MDSASFQFLAFGFAIALISNLSRSRIWRSAVLLVASLVFIGLLEKNPLALAPLAAFLLLGYVCLWLIEHGWSKTLPSMLAIVVLAYVWLKKYTFLPPATLLHFPYFVLGLSYIFFRVLYLLIEAAGSAENQHVGLGAYLLYTINFTSFVAGPVQRYDEFARDQFAIEPIALAPGVAALQVERIVRGFFKVNVLAMIFDIVHNDAIAELMQPLPASLKLYPAVRLVASYPFFLYCNFSGYIDIVIGLARLMRLRLPENFNRPFSASSALDFWNRWHISLSTWFKSYVYNPLLLGLMRRISSTAVEPLLGVFCFFVTFFLMGLWHGRTSEFIVFGVLTGTGVSVNKLWQVTLTRAMGRKGYRELARNAAYLAAGRGLNFLWFAFTLFWFWGDWKQLHAIFSALSSARWAAVWLAVGLAITAVLAVWEWLRGLLLSFANADGPLLTNRYARVIYASALGLAAVVITLLLSQPAPGIVYKAF